MILLGGIHLVNEKPIVAFIVPTSNEDVSRPPILGIAKKEVVMGRVLGRKARTSGCILSY